VGWARLLIAPIYLGCSLAFLTDITRQDLLAFGLFYLPLVCTAVFYRDPRAVWWLAGAASVLITIGYFVPAVHPERSAAVTNRALSIAAVIVTAVLLRHARHIQDR
jgi:hypothetical protein